MTGLDKSALQRPAVGATVRRAALQLLRHWDRPNRLAGNALAELLSDRGIDVRNQDAMQRYLLDAIEHLSGRQRVILHRCDILHEIHGDVYGSLGLSRRQFYRERTLAIENLTHVLLEPQRMPGREEASRLALQLAHAHALEQVGRWHEAVDLLEDVLQNGTPPNARLAALCRLVQLHARAERPSLANAYLRLARNEARTVNTPELATALADVAEAELSLACSTEMEAESACRRATPVLRQHAALAVDVELCEALAQSLSIESQIALEQGNFAGFVAAAQEAQAAIVRCGRPNRVVAHEVGATVAYSRLFDGSSLQFAEAELWRHYHDAVDGSLLRQATLDACSLARFYTRARRPDRSDAILSEVLPSARAAVRGEPLTVLLLEASEAAYWRGDRASAHHFLLEAKETVSQGRLCHHVDLALAHLHLKDGRFHEALELAESAEAGLARMKRTRYQGSALRLQAEALAGLGQRRRAIRTALIAAEILEHAGTPFARKRIWALIDSLSPRLRDARRANLSLQDK